MKLTKRICFPVLCGPWSNVGGDEIAVHDVRNLTHRTKEDIDAKYEDRTVRLSELSDVDIVVIYWAGNAIADIMVTFGFDNNQ